LALPRSRPPASAPSGPQVLSAADFAADAAGELWCRLPEALGAALAAPPPGEPSPGAAPPPVTLACGSARWVGEMRPRAPPLHYRACWTVAWTAAAAALGLRRGDALVFQRCAAGDGDDDDADASGSGVGMSAAALGRGEGRVVRLTAFRACDHLPHSTAPTPWPPPPPPSLPPLNVAALGGDAPTVSARVSGVGRAAASAAAAGSGGSAPARSSAPPSWLLPPGGGPAAATAASGGSGAGAGSESDGWPDSPGGG